MHPLIFPFASRWIRFCLAAIACLGCREATAQAVVAVRIVDINSAADTSGVSNPTYDSVYLPAQARYFYVNVDHFGRELWVAENHPKYGRLVKDLWPGSGSSDPSQITSTAQGCYFFANDGGYGASLWYSDGTPSGTRIVGSPTPGSPLSGLSAGVLIAPDAQGAFVVVRKPSGVTEVYYVLESNLDHVQFLTSLSGNFAWTVDVAPGSSGNRFFALARNTALGGATTLVGSNGTAAGTTVTVDAFPAAPVGEEGQEVRVVNPAQNIAVLSVYGSGVGRELWITNGTWAGGAGTQLTLDAQPGTIGSKPSNLVSDGSYVFYACDDGVHGVEMWRSTGYTASTQLVVDIDPFGSSDAVPLGQVGGRIVLRASGQLFTWDGVNATSLTTSFIGVPRYWQVMPGSQLLILETGSALWVTNGLPWFTQQVARPALDFGEIKDMFSLPGAVGFLETPVAEYCDAVRLWVVDDAATWSLARAIAEPRSGPRNGDSNPRDFFLDGQQVLFNASEGGALEALCRLNMSTSPASYSKVRDFAPGPSEFVRLDSGAVLFVAGEMSGAPVPSGVELWATAGQTSTTFLLPEIVPGAGSSYPSNLTKVGAQVFMAATHPVYGRELYRVDSVQYPTLVSDLRPGGLGAEPQQLTGVGSFLYFTADNGVTGRELYRVDPVTLVITAYDLRPGAASSLPTDLVDAGGTLFYVADLGSGRALYRFDPASGSGVQLTAPVVGFALAPSRLEVVGPSLVLFSGFDLAHGREPWLTQGTPGSTQLLADIVPGAGSSNPEEFEVAGTGWFCVARRPAEGYEVFQLGAAGPGSAVPLDVHPTSDSYPSDLRSFRGTLVFAADDGVTGNELWQYDPRTGQLRLLVNLAPETTGVPASSFVRGFFEALGTILMSARDGYYAQVGLPSSGIGEGRELYQIISPLTVPSLVQPIGSPCPVAGYSPTMQAVGVPSIGNLGFALTMQSAPPVSIALLAISDYGFPWPFAGCWIYPQLPVPFLVATLPDALGTASVVVPIPYLPAAIGVEFGAQYVLLAPGDALGTSNAVYLRVGG